jgi:curli biogenesis system outer membrane secretion channel CsgG
VKPARAAVPAPSPAAAAPAVADEPATADLPAEETAPLAGKPIPGALNFAVSDLQPQGISKSDAAVIAEMLRTELIRAGVFNVVEKANMDKLLAEQAFQQTGCTTSECAVKLGKLLNANGIVVGSFGKLLNRYLVSVRLVDVETGQAVVAEEAKGDTVDEIEKAVDGMVLRMAAAVR